MCTVVTMTIREGRREVNRPMMNKLVNDTGEGRESRFRPLPYVPSRGSSFLSPVPDISACLKSYSYQFYQGFDQVYPREGLF